MHLFMAPIDWRKKMRTKLLMIFCAVLLTSCASAPKRQSVKNIAPVPGEWSTNVLARSENDSVWWSEFRDVKLNKIMDEAFEKNQTLHIAASNVFAAAAQARIAGAPLLPQANLNFNTQKMKQNFIGFPIPGSEGKVLSTTNTSYGANLSMSWELDLWGKLKANEVSAIANVQAAQADLLGARLSLTAQVCKAWFAAIEANRQVELSRATVENFRTSAEQVRTRYERGLRSSLDLRMSLSNLAMNESTFSQRKAQYEMLVRQLEILLGRYPSATLEISDNLPDLIEEIPAGLPAEIISRRPDLISAERSLMASKAMIKNSKGALYPQFSLTGTSGSSTKEFSSLLDGDFGIWSIAGSVLQPIFQRGRLKAGVELAERSADIALEQYAQTILNAYAEVENALSSERYLRQRHTSIEIAAEQSIAARELAEEQYSRGLSDFITMLESQRSAYDNESQLLTIRREQLDARIDLYLALGGSFDYSPDIIENINGAEKNE